MILYKENRTESRKSLLEPMSEFSKVAGYKINIQKSVAFLHASNELYQRETKKTVPFIALTRWLNWLECCPLHQKVECLIPGQGTYLGCEFNPWLGCVQEATD